MEYSKGKKTRLSRNFALSEFACPCDACEIVLVSPALVSILEAVRAHFNRPIRINSGYRCPSHNASPKVRGATNSRHLYGEAADIVVTLVSPPTVAAYLDALAVPGLGRYASFTHVDVRNNPTARWTG